MILYWLKLHNSILKARILLHALRVMAQFISSCLLYPFFYSYIWAAEVTFTEDRWCLLGWIENYWIELWIESKFPRSFWFSCQHNISHSCYYSLSSFFSDPDNFLGGRLTGLKDRWQYKSLILCGKRYSIMLYFSRDSDDCCGRL